MARCEFHSTRQPQAGILPQHDTRAPHSTSRVAHAKATWRSTRSLTALISNHREPAPDVRYRSHQRANVHRIGLSSNLLRRAALHLTLLVSRTVMSGPC
ncbi:hypothetical protein MRB53_038167 [Persea americana]|nr:hypothetical protein MRB53_038167 [Persea americana]